MLAKPNHLLFAWFLAVLLLAPRLPLVGIAQTERSSLSLGIVVLLIWAFKEPQVVLRPIIPALLSLNLFILFLIYCIVPTLFGARTSSIILSFQYCSYGLLGYFLISSYVKRAYWYDELERSVKLISLIGFIYAIGGIVSLFTGPIYPYQVGTVGRFWGLGERLPQGVGFGVNQNMVGGLMVILYFNVLYLYHGPRRKLILIIQVAAIFATISRSAILSFLVALVMTALFKYVSKMLQKRSFYFRVSLLKTLFIFFLSLAVITASVFATVDPIYIDALKFGFGFSETSIYDSEQGRFEQWSLGLVAWQQLDFVQKIIGVGFRNSASISEGAFITAHNYFIEALNDFGLLGLCLLLISIVSLLVFFMRLALSETADFGKMGFSVTIALVVHNMTEAFFYSYEYVVLFLLTSLLVVYGKQGSQFADSGSPQS